MAWGIGSEDIEREEYERRCEERIYEERREEDAQLEAYYEYYFSPDGWIDRLYDTFVKEYGKD